MIVYPSCCSCMHGEPPKLDHDCWCHKPPEPHGCQVCGAETLAKNENGKHIGCPMETERA